NDLVRLEIDAALKRNIPVTPVLVQGAQVPAADQLPEGIKDLTNRNAFELSHARWDSDVREMLKRLGIAPPQEARTIGESTARKRLPLPLGVFIVGVLAIVAAALLVLWSISGLPREPTTSSQTAQAMASDLAAAKKKLDESDEPGQIGAIGL